jgi:pimeloyl-ACP methyl ester carboxylesterase
MGNALSHCSRNGSKQQRRESQPARRPLVVALHGAATNGEIMKQQLGELMPWLLDNVELHFLEGLEATPEDHPQASLIRIVFGKEQRLLQYASWAPDARGVRQFVPESLSGALESLERRMRQFRRPVDCLIGFSMGATIAALLCNRDSERLLIRRACLLCAVSPTRWGLPAGAPSINAPALVVSGTRDDVVGDTAVAVALHFGLARALVHNEGHLPLPRDRDSLERLMEAIKSLILARADEDLEKFRPHGGHAAEALFNGAPARPVGHPAAIKADAQMRAHALEAIALMNGEEPPWGAASLPASPPATVTESAEDWTERFLSWQSMHAWKQLPSVRRVWASSDLHVEGAPNMEFLHTLSGFESDALVLAGDVCTSLHLLKEVFTLLTGKFKAVFYCVGNHELWQDRSLAEPEAGPNSLTRLLEILRVATDAGVHASAALVGDDLAVVPLQSWYHYGFSGPRCELADPPDDFELRHMDGACDWTPFGPAVRSTSRLLAPHFARLNEPLLSEAASRAAGRTVISLSHFLPQKGLHRGYGYLSDVEGSWLLGEQVERLRPAVHVFGHTHWAIDETINGVRYVQYPLGYAHERVKERYRVRASEQAPFALLWEGTV